jgi:alkanesulfonate monooxygenase SsuD/methylene tetrahydromethanopterin reductase-like flavin-dependent oxidoreductase (luciferase family)
VTERITLGTGSLIPHRHPIHAALAAASLEFVAGPGRVILGMGLGSFHHEFEACGLGQADRRVLMEEQVAIFRKLWSGETVSHQGPYYQFSEVDIHPVPAAPIPIWYCGISRAAIRRTVEYCDGWLPGVMPLPIFEQMMARLRRLANEAGKPLPTVGQIPLVVPAPTAEEALHHYSLPNLFEFCNRVYGRLGGGPYRTPEDLEGAIIYGPPERIVEGVLRLQQAGCNLLVFDMRHRFADFEACLELIGREVLPALPRGAAAAPR